TWLVVKGRPRTNWLDQTRLSTNLGRFTDDRLDGEVHPSPYVLMKKKNAITRIRRGRTRGRKKKEGRKGRHGTEFGRSCSCSAVGRKKDQSEKK
ncbi:unnamed protein product, partial [Linum tenue]